MHLVSQHLWEDPGHEELCGFNYCIIHVDIIRTAHEMLLQQMTVDLIVLVSNTCAVTAHLQKNDYLGSSSSMNAVTACKWLFFCRFNLLVSKIGTV